MMPDDNKLLCSTASAPPPATPVQRAFPQCYWMAILITILLVPIFLLWPFLFTATTSHIHKRAAWHPSFNTYQALKYTYASTFNVSNCWICMAIPSVHGGLSLMASPLNVTETWTSLLNNTANITSANSVALQLSFRHNGILCFQRNYSKEHHWTCKMGWSNCNHSIQGYQCTNNSCLMPFYPIYQILKNTIFSNDTIRRVFWAVFHGFTPGNPTLSNITILVQDCYFICGKRAYKWLPVNWSGSCFLGYLIPAIRHTTVLPQGKFRNTQKIKTPSNPVGNVDASWIYHYDLAHASNKGLAHMDLGDDVISWAGIIPAYGTVKSIWELRKLSKLLEVLSNATFSALELVTDEMTAMRAVVLQNCMALDFVLAIKGGTCALIQEECCTFIPDNQHEIESHLELIQKVSELSETEKADSSTWAWLTNLFSGWGGGLLKLILKIVVLIIFIFLLLFIIKTCVLKLMSSKTNANFHMPAITDDVQEKSSINDETEKLNSMVILEFGKMYKELNDDAYGASNGGL
ncbi:uncharacterized protein LOC122792266 [Protopterus annectens]|uniref:uncharacterized protein LOC122792266 n=1 Tax=Protopterus annectens TaxID=7888 RepID=UPI001CF9D3B8|nr:uncharacterized protein LOC122792266 [Protopterus annectens]XP_043915953.1 uncharacterized protein LOC122792266 [Protopterus annectens]XP_043915954.1 uncharacterized protein LOC122792266 [Protopterus annectens]